MSESTTIPSHGQHASPAPAHGVLAVVFQVRDGELQALLWERGREPFRGAWSLPGGSLAPHETLEASILRHLATKVDVRDVAHLEQLGTWSDPGRHPERWELATAYPASSRSASTPACRPTRAGIPSTRCRTAFDHGAIVVSGRERLRGSSRTRTRVRARPGYVHARGASRRVRGRARLRRLRDEPEACAAPSWRDRADRRTPRTRPDRRTSCAGIPFPEPPARSDRPVRGATTSGLRAGRGLQNCQSGR